MKFLQMCELECYQVGHMNGDKFWWVIHAVACMQQLWSGQWYTNTYTDIYVCVKTDRENNDVY